MIKFSNFLCAGEIRYGKNGQHVSSLMHIDKTLPMWAFFDVYGNTQKIKILGELLILFLMMDLVSSGLSSLKIII